MSDPTSWERYERNGPLGQPAYSEAKANEDHRLLETP
jgi:hypothetical protein